MKKQDFGKTKDGRSAFLYTISNNKGMHASFTDFGAAWVSAYVPDRDGKLRDVLLGFDDVSSYESKGGALGGIVGRVANRIGGARFELNGIVYTLAKTSAGNNLHSGPNVYHKRYWDVEDAQDDRIIFSLYSPDGDQGYPGALKIRVSYQVTEENEVRISYNVKAEEDTIWNLTNHAYFNLSGHSAGSVLDHSALLFADMFTPGDENSLPTGEIWPVDGTPMDFRTEKKVGRDIDTAYDQLIFGNGYDHNYVLNKRGYHKAAELRSDESGIVMDVFTDRPGIQLYTANYLSDPQAKDGAVYVPRCSICFETQNFPDAVNHDNFPSPVIRKGEEAETVTAYRFGTY